MDPPTSPNQDLDAGDLEEEDARRQATALREEIRHHDHLYHVEGRPEISDAAYDRLFNRLKELEAAHPGIITADSPTRRVGAAPREDLPTAAHAAPMLSLDSTLDPAELRRFDERVRTAVDGGKVEYLLQPKLDGVSIELVYEEGVLTRGITRGNGWEGEEVTDNIRTIPPVPLRLREEERPAPDFLSVRGEVMMSISAFEAHNQALLEEGDAPFANPRNAASGAIRQLDSSITARRPLNCFAYDVLDISGSSFRTDQESVKALRMWGFRVPERTVCVETVEDILEYHEGFRRDRDGLDYEIDGVVIKLNDLDERVDLGTTSRHPRWALALKFEPRKEVTRIERIAVQVGRTGVLTPVALLLPVEVGGVTVARATLHNREELERKDIREGDRVRVQRAGDVIPQVVEVLTKDGAARPPPFAMPETCPNCGTPVLGKGPFTICPNRFGCSAQLKGRLVHFAARDALDVEGLGSETASLLVERRLVREPADLFDLTEEDLLSLPGFATKSAENLVAAIRSRRSTELRRFLVGLGIPEVGVTVARDLATHFREVEEILGASEERLQEVPGIGPKMAVLIREFLEEPRNEQAIQNLLRKLRRPLAVLEAGSAGPLTGRSFVFTGKLESMSRSRARQLVERAGGKATTSVSGETDVLVAGEGGGSKLERALALGVEVLDEAGFLALLEHSGVEA